MHRFILSMVATMALVVSGCAIQDVTVSRDELLRSYFPYGARWVKEGMTRESRKADWMACGGGVDLQDEFRKWIQPEAWESFWPQKEAHRKNLWLCMSTKGYEYFIKGYEFELPKLAGRQESCNAKICFYP